MLCKNKKSCVYCYSYLNDNDDDNDKLRNYVYLYIAYTYKSMLIKWLLFFFSLFLASCYVIITIYLINNVLLFASFFMYIYFRR